MKNDVIATCANALQYAGVAVQTNETMQYIQLGLSILTSLIIIAFKLWRWYKEAKKDGKITADEITEALDIIKENDKEKDK